MLKRLAFEAMVDNEFRDYGVVAEHANVLKKRYQKNFDALYEGLKNYNTPQEAYEAYTNKRGAHGGLASLVVYVCEKEEIGIFC